MLLVVVQSPSCVRFFATLWTVTFQAPLSMGFPRQEYQSGLPFPSLGHLPKPGIESMSPALADRFRCVCAQSLSHFWLFEMPWTIAHQPPLSIEFSRQEYWSNWVAISYSKAFSWPRDQTLISCLLHCQVDSLPLSHL